MPPLKVRPSWPPARRARHAVALGARRLTRRHGNAVPRRTWGRDSGPRIATAWRGMIPPLHRLAVAKRSTSSIRVGCAGWSIPREHADRFPEEGSHLARYAGRFPAVEINSSFYKPHRPATYARWAASVPASGAFPRDTVLSPRPTSRMRSPAWSRRRPSRSPCSSCLFPPGRTPAPSRCGPAGWSRT